MMNPIQIKNMIICNQISSSDITPPPPPPPPSSSNTVLSKSGLNILGYVADNACNLLHNQNHQNEVVTTLRNHNAHEYINEVRDNDVLCGRGGQSNHHPGNKRFREVISEMKVTYQNADRKLKKTNLTHTIVNYVHSYGGRFIKRDLLGTKSFFLLTKTEARRKTSQALRDQKSLDFDEQKKQQQQIEEQQHQRNLPTAAVNCYEQNYQTGNFAIEKSHSKLIYIDKICANDILCGRGGQSNHHPGNKRFRQVISESKITYKNTEKKLKKTDLSRTIVDYVHNYGGRFIKRDPSTGKYFLLTKIEARRKTSQALRELKKIK